MKKLIGCLMLCLCMILGCMSPVMAASKTPSVTLMEGSSRKVFSSYKKLSWTTSNRKVAVVDKKKGTIKAIKSGNAKVVIKINNKRKTYNVYVYSKSNVKTTEGSTYKFAKSGSVKSYRIANKSIVKSVNRKNKTLKAGKAGKTYINVVYTNGKRVRYYVTVNKKKVVKPTVTPKPTVKPIVTPKPTVEPIPTPSEEKPDVVPSGDKVIEKTVSGYGYILLDSTLGKPLNVSSTDRIVSYGGDDGFNVVRPYLQYEPSTVDKIVKVTVLYKGYTYRYYINIKGVDQSVNSPISREPLELEVGKGYIESMVVHNQLLEYSLEGDNDCVDFNVKSGGWSIKGKKKGTVELTLVYEHEIISYVVTVK